MNGEPAVGAPSLYQCIVSKKVGASIHNTHPERSVLSSINIIHVYRDFPRILGPRESNSWPIFYDISELSAVNLSARITTCPLLNKDP